jgi:hypothetical protein
MKNITYIIDINTSLSLEWFIYGCYGQGKKEQLQGKSHFINEKI